MDHTVIVPTPNGIHFNIKDHGFCFICNISISSWEVKQEHVEGKRHLRKVNQLFHSAGFGTQENHSPENFRGCHLCREVVLGNVEDHLVSMSHRSKGSVGENANQAAGVGSSPTVHRAPSENDDSLTLPKMADIKPSPAAAAEFDTSLTSPKRAEVRPSMTIPKTAASAEVDASLTLTKTKPCVQVQPYSPAEFPANTSPQVRNGNPSASTEDDSSSIFIAIPAADACGERRDPTPCHQIDNLKLTSIENTSSSTSMATSATASDERPAFQEPVVENTKANNILDQESISYNSGITKLNIPLPEVPEPQHSEKTATDDIKDRDHYCKLCFTELSGPKSAKQHYESTNHKTKEEIADLVNSGTLRKDPETGASMNRFDGIDWYVCSVCMRRLNSAKTYSEHIQTERHISNETLKKCGYTDQKGK